MSPSAHPSVRAGLAYGLAGFFMWGLSPLYWRALAAAGPWEVLAYRIVGTVAIAGLMLGFHRRMPELLKALRDPRIQRDLALSTLLIGGNWMCFVWAVMVGRTLEASMGYFLCPLVTVGLGALLLKEPLTRAQLFAIGLAAAGVGVLLIGLNVLPWISLFLATSFAVYGYIRKRVRVDALEGLFVETVLWLAPSLCVLWFLPHAPHVASQWWLLVLAGPFTLLPLLFYTQSARRLRLSTLGFIQYTAPTMQFLIAALVFHELVTAPHLIAFGAIWASILIFTWDSIRRERRAPAEATP